MKTKLEHLRSSPRITHYHLRVAVKWWITVARVTGVAWVSVSNEETTLRSPSTHHCSVATEMQYTRLFFLLRKDGDMGFTLVLLCVLWRKRSESSPIYGHCQGVDFCQP